MQVTPATYLPSAVNDMIKVHVEGGGVWAYSPQVDITAYELAKIQQLLSIALMGSSVTGIREYLSQHNLMRHFRLTA